MAVNERLMERIISEKENAFPQDVAIETTGFCNLNCIMCSNNKMKRKKGAMRWTLFIKLVEEIAEKAKDYTRLWLCFYGEPLMSKDIADRIIFAKSKGIKNVVINSNMNLMNPELAEELVKSGLNSVFVGLDATTAEVYSGIRRNGDFEKVVRNVIYYKEMLDKFGTDDQQIVVQFVDMPQNHHQRDLVVSFWSKHGIQVKVRPLVTWHDSIADVLHSQEVLGSHEVERAPCHWIMNVLPITSDGKAVWCGCDYDGQGVCGDLNSDTIGNVWNNVKKQHRLIHTEGRWDELPEFCRSCADWKGAYATYDH
ncbi:MAG: radical SAM protein [Clostridiales Family XIII bacterium]|jgi:sulfatase maturation enzyme AslB (radical SAM superfamily)|nr:radical SAM protein [Clostridiales Family XIII bacterium]